MDLNQQPQRKKKHIPLRLQDPAKSEKPEPVVKRKKIDQKSKSDQRAMSVHEGKMFQCSICNSKITLESHWTYCNHAISYAGITLVSKIFMQALL